MPWVWFNATRLAEVPHCIGGIVAYLFFLVPWGNHQEIQCGISYSFVGDHGLPLFWPGFILDFRDIPLHLIPPNPPSEGITMVDGMQLYIFANTERTAEYDTIEEETQIFL